MPDLAAGSFNPGATGSGFAQSGAGPLDTSKATREACRRACRNSIGEWRTWNVCLPFSRRRA